MPRYRTSITNPRERQGAPGETPEVENLMWECDAASPDAALAEARVECRHKFGAGPPPDAEEQVEEVG